MAVTVPITVKVADLPAVKAAMADLVAAAVAADDKLKAVRKALVRYASDPAMVPLIHDLLDIIDAEDEPEPEFSPAERQRMHELAERLTWTCEGCGGKLIGGNPPRCIGCRHPESGIGRAG